MPRLGGGKSYDLQQFVWTSISAWHTPLWLASGWECPDQRLSTAPKSPGTTPEPSPCHLAKHKRRQCRDVPTPRWVHSARSSGGQGTSETLPPLLFPAAAPDTPPHVCTQDTWLAGDVVHHRARKKHLATRGALPWGFCVRVRLTRERLAAQVSEAVCPRDIVSAAPH